MSRFKAWVINKNLIFRFEIEILYTHTKLVFMVTRDGAEMAKLSLSEKKVGHTDSYSAV